MKPQNCDKYSARNDYSPRIGWERSMILSWLVFAQSLSINL